MRSVAIFRKNDRHFFKTKFAEFCRDLPRFTSRSDRHFSLVGPDNLSKLKNFVRIFFKNWLLKLDIHRGVHQDSYIGDILRFSGLQTVGKCQYPNSILILYHKYSI